MLLDLQARGGPWSYFSEPTKSILVVAPRNVAREEKFFRGMGMTVVTASRYIGGFISKREDEGTYLFENMKGWAE